MPNQRIEQKGRRFGKDEAAKRLAQGLWPVHFQVFAGGVRPVSFAGDATHEATQQGQEAEPHVVVHLREALPLANKDLQVGDTVRIPASHVTWLN